MNRTDQVRLGGPCFSKNRFERLRLGKFGWNISFV